METCVQCKDEYPDAELNADGACEACAKHVSRAKRFREFAAEMGLYAYPDPSGERYLYGSDGICAGKKSENIEFMDDLWDALARSKGREDLIIGEEDEEDEGEE